VDIVNAMPIIGGCVSDASKCVDVLSIGLFNGLIVALVAMGYTLVYGILQLINFAHGDVFMIGTMLTFFAVTALPGIVGLDATLWMALLFLPFIMVITAVLNASIERVAYRPLRNAPTLATLISAIGMSFVLQNVGIIILGPSPKALPDLLPSVADFGPLSFPLVFGAIEIGFDEIFVAAIAIPLLIALAWFVRSTRQGKAMRATAQDREAAGLMGVDVNRTIAITFLIAGALAGAGGLIVALFNGQTQWNYGFSYGLLAFTSAVFGGIGNLTGAFLGGVILGVIQAMMNFYVDPRWTDVVVFSILVLILVFRPTGLMGGQVAERA
jgi:branched-chain amino acid transport system permease protein